VVAASAMLLARSPALPAGAPAGGGLSDERLEAAYTSGGTFVHSTALDAYLAEVLRQLQSANPELASLSLRIHCLTDDLPYSFVLGNGAAYVTTGLLARLDDQAQLSATLALTLAPWIRHDRDSLDAEGHRRLVRNFLPNLLLLTATAGFGAPALAKADAKARANSETQAQSASDAVAVDWIARAGYAPDAAALALTGLRDALLSEQRAGQTEFSDPELLKARSERLSRKSSEPAPIPTISTNDSAAQFARFSNHYALAQAAADLAKHPVSVLPILERTEKRQGETGYSAYLRAELTRRNIEGPPGVAAAIAAYEKCVTHTDAPAAAYRELGLLYRRSGELERARATLLKYLDRAPTADDAPIIRTYLDDLK
jgi:hypothetical protein